MHRCGIQCDIFIVHQQFPTPSMYTYIPYTAQLIAQWETVHVVAWSTRRCIFFVPRHISRIYE